MSNRGDKSKFKQIFTTFFNELVAIHREDAVLDLVVVALNNFTDDQLYSIFEEQLNRKRDDGKDLFEHHRNKNYYRVFEIVCSDLETNTGVKIDFAKMLGNEDDREFIFMALESCINCFSI